MRKLTKLIGVALIATGMMASFTGCTGLYNQIDELEKELEAEKAKNDKLEKDKADLEKAIAALNEEITAAEKKAADLKKEIESLQDDNGNIPDDKKAELEAKIKELEDEKLKLEAKIDKAEKDLEAARTELEELQNTINELNASVYGLKYIDGEGEIPEGWLGALPKYWNKSDTELKDYIENNIRWKIGGFYIDESDSSYASSSPIKVVVNLPEVIISR